MFSEYPVIKTKSGEIPLSHGLLIKRFMSLGFRNTEAFETTFHFINWLREESWLVMTISEFKQQLTRYLSLFHPEYTHRHEILISEFKGFLPLIVFMGGVTGVGKSVLAHDFSDLLSSVQVVSTDLIREIMRMTLPKSIIPTVHKSSYDVGSLYSSVSLTSNQISYRGFEMQATLVNLGLQPIIKDISNQNQFAVIEGVHLSPKLMATEKFENAITVKFLLVTENPETHYFHLRKRLTLHPKREFDLDKHFSTIRYIQSQLIEEAKEYSIHIIKTDTEQEPLYDLINALWKELDSINQSFQNRKEM